MNIHEIIHAWETNALPADFDQLAAIQNKVDDYNKQAIEREQKTSSTVVGSMYKLQNMIFDLITSDIDGLVESLPPRPAAPMKGGCDE